MTDSYDHLAPLYDLINAGVQDDLPFYLALVAEMGGPVLELGCGSGRTLIPLAEAGYDVVGLDSSPAMLERARTRLERSPFAEHVRLVQGDMTGFDLQTTFPLITVPFHAWLPDAHSSAPSPISAMLSGVLIKAVGVYAIMRLFFNMFTMNYEISMLITVIGTVSMVGGVLLAVGQWDLKRLLAYHSISQMGYVVLGIGMGMVILSVDGNRAVAALAIFGGLYHMVNHAVFKGLLFLNAGAIEYKTGTRMLRELGGLSENMPLTASTSLSASMAISGIPPFNGFFSKLIIIMAAVQGRFYLMALLAVIVSIITLASFMKVHRYAFSGVPRFKNKKLFGEAPFTMALPMVVLALLCLGLSLLVIPSVRNIFLTPAVDALINTLNYAKPILEL